MAPGDSNNSKNVYGTTDGGDEPTKDTRQDSGISQSETRAANDPTQDVAGTAAETTERPD